jgi:hypothetical protein
MRRRGVATVVAGVAGVAMLVAACSGDDGTVGPSTTSATATTNAATPTTTTTTVSVAATTSTVAAGVAAPNGRRRPVAPDDPLALAAEIETTERALRDLATPAAELPDLGHRNQAAYRRLGIHDEWDDDVLAALPVDLAAFARDHAEARRTLAAMHPDPSAMVPAWEIREPEPADQLLSHYREAESATGIEWEYLAAINLVETGFGRIRGLSVAGAQGPMQFLPSTWNERGIGEGDIDDPHDAIQAAARYLVRRGGPGDMERALRGYNNSPNYVRAVTLYAGLMRQDERALTVFHEWEVHYLSAAGDLWLPVGYHEAAPIPVEQYLARAPWSRPVD